MGGAGDKKDRAMLLMENSRRRDCVMGSEKVSSFWDLLTTFSGLVMLHKSSFDATCLLD